MKRLPFFTAAALFFVFTACQKDNDNVATILETNKVQEEALQLAKDVKIEVADITADTDGLTCQGKAFAESLQTAVDNHQTEANETCQTIRTFAAGCLHGYMTYATVFVRPDNGNCLPTEPVTGNTSGDLTAKQDNGLPIINFSVNLTTTDCFNGGTSIAAEIEEFGTASYRYQFDWNLDGKPIAESQRVECLKGEALVLTVTQVPGRTVVKRYIKLQGELDIDSE